MSYFCERAADVTPRSAATANFISLKNYNVNTYPAKKGRDSILHGIQWIQQHKIIIHEKCYNFMREIQAYKWKEDKWGSAMSVPVDKDNNLLDALRYAYSHDMEMSDSIIFT
jgi:phage terminase large subunit